MLTYKKVKIAIVGSRTFNDYSVLSGFIRNKCNEHHLTPTAVVSGGARGADTLGARYANDYQLPLILHKPDWNRYGKAAGFLRNKDIIKDCDVCFAFWDGKSRGTEDDINICKQMGKPCYICKF